MASEQSWARHAACKGTPTELFYPPPDDVLRLRRAKTICLTCTVRAQCLDHALHHEPYGIWGGLSQRELRQRRRALRITVTESVPQLLP